MKKNSRIFINIIAAFVLYNAIAFYIGWNVFAWLDSFLTIPHPWIVLLVVGVVAYSYFISRAFDVFSIFKIIGAYWFGILQYSLLLFPLANLTVFLLSLNYCYTEQIIFWTGTAVLALFILIFSIGTFNAYTPIVRKYEINIPKQAGTLKHLRLAVASDMHFGLLSGVAHVKRLVKYVNGIGPDLVLLPGDVIDDDTKIFIKKNMTDILKDIKAPLGVYGILGNHEHYGKEIPKYLQTMKDINIPILLDEVIKIEDSIQIVGRRDYTEKNRKTISELVDGLDSSLPIILLDHQPYQLTQAMEHGVDVSLSGHTHRGQMAPNHFITKKIFELDWGYKQKKQLHAFVSSGFGFWGPPLRLGSRSEILQIDIVFSKDKSL